MHFPVKIAAYLLKAKKTDPQKEKRTSLIKKQNEKYSEGEKSKENGHFLIHFIWGVSGGGIHFVVLPYH